MKSIPISGDTQVKIHEAGGGVQVVSVYAKGQKYGAHLAEFDYYAFTPDEVIGTNRPEEIPEGSQVRTGALIDKQEFMEIYNAALKETWPSP